MKTKLTNNKIRIAILALGLSFFGASHAEEPTPITPELFQQLVQEGKYDTARKLMHAVSNNPLDFAILDADIAVAQGNFSAAIEIYREILQVLPDVDLVRFKLAQALAQNRQFDSASYHLKILRDQTEDEQMRQFFTEQLDAVQQTQPYGFSVDFGLSPSTNINSAGQPVEDKPFIFGTTITTPDELKPHFGWRANLGVNGYYRVALADQNSLIARFGANMNRFTYPTIDNDSANFSLNYRYENARLTFEIGPFINKFWGDGKVYDVTNNQAVIGHRDENFTTTGYAASIDYILTPRIKIGLGGNHSDVKYDSSYYDYKRGYTNSLNLSVKYAVDRETSVDLNLGGSFHAEAGSDKSFVTQNGYSGRNFGISVTKLFENGLKVSFGGDYTLRDYQTFQNFYNFARHDKVNGFSLSLQNNNWQVGNFVPKMNCRYENTHSNIEDYKIQDTSCGFTLSTEF